MWVKVALCSHLKGWINLTGSTSVSELLSFPSSPLFNQLSTQSVLLLWYLHFFIFLAGSIFFWSYSGQNVLSLRGNSCKTMWWANSFWYIEVLLSRHACKRQWIPPLWGFFFPPAFGGCYWKPWLQGLIVYFVLPSFSRDLHMTVLLVWQTKQTRNSTGSLPTARTMDRLHSKL